jgi:hypothetical protein
MIQSIVSEKKIAIAIFIYTAFLLCFWSYMSPFYHSNEEMDVNVYFTIGKSIFQGKVLYTDLFDHKGPVVYFIYGLGALISSHSFWGVFLLEILAWSLMIFAIYRTAKFYLNIGFAYLTALLFPFFLSFFMKAGGTPEEFILAFECISLYFFVSYFKEKDATIHKPHVMLIHGAMFSLVFFCKFNLALFWFFPISGVFLNLLLKKKFRNFAWNLLAFLSGILLVALPIFIYLSINHAFDEFYALYFESNRKYSAIQSIGESIQLLLLRIAMLFTRPFELFILPLLGIFYFPFRYINSKLGKWVFLLAGISLYVAVFVSKIHLSYYPIPFLVCSILGILTIFAVVQTNIDSKKIKIKYLLILSVLMFFAGIELKDTSDVKGLDFMKAKPGLFMENIRREILKEKNPTLMTPNHGLAISLFTTCRIIPNIRYFFSAYITNESFPSMRNEQTKYIENKIVQFVVLSVPNTDMRYKKWKLTSKITDEKRNAETPSIVQYYNLKEDIYNYFTTLPAFQENYELCLRDTVINTIEQNSVNIYELYKRKD